MEIKFKTSLAGPGGTYQAGEIVEMPEKKALRYLNSGAAEAHGKKPSIEKAVAEAPETRAAFPEEEAKATPKKVARRNSSSSRKRSKPKTSRS